MASIQEIASTLRSIAVPEMKPRALRSAIKKRYPDATKKEIVRAALYAVTEAPSADGSVTADLHNFALAERISEENADEASRVSRGKKKKRSSGSRVSSPVH